MKIPEPIKIIGWSCALMFAFVPVFKLFMVWLNVVDGWFK